MGYVGHQHLSLQQSDKRDVHSSSLKAQHITSILPIYQYNPPYFSYSTLHM